MPFPKRTCVVCGDEFELRPDKPGFANRCWACSEAEEEEKPSAGDYRTDNTEMNEERRKAMRDMLYKKEQ